MAGKAELRDARAQAKIAIRIDRVTTGNFGDCKILRDGVCELRIDGGPAIVCSTPCWNKLVYLLLGGNTRKQPKDIEQALVISRTVGKGQEN